MNLRLTHSQQPYVEPATQIILASQSVGRKMLLDKLGLRFRVAPTHVDEDSIADPDPVKMLRRRAGAKSNEIVAHPAVYQLSEIAKTLVVTADSMAILGKRSFGKPANQEEAKDILRALMGKTHTFVTAVVAVLLDTHKEKKRWEKVIKTKVTLRKLPPAELDAYVARYDLTRFAAAYAFNEAPWDLVTRIDGSYTNVIGLPFEVLLPILRSLKIIS